MTSPTPQAVFRRVADQAHAGPGADQGPRLVAPGSATEGELGLFEIAVDPGGSTVTTHYHTTFSKSFYILEGRVDLHLDGRVVSAGPGDFAYVPRESPHGFINTTDKPARMLILFTPGVPREEYFREIAELFADGNRPTRAQIDELARRHDQFNIRPG